MVPLKLLSGKGTISLPTTQGLSVRGLSLQGTSQSCRKVFRKGTAMLRSMSFPAQQSRNQRKIAAKNTKTTKIMARESRELARMNREDDNHLHPRDSLAMLFLFVPFCVFCGYCKSLRQTKNLTVSSTDSAGTMGNCSMFFAAILFAVSFLMPSATAQDWAEKMFNTQEHDFGVVARGADTVYRFEITNLYKQTMHISGVRSSCGCTTPTIENATIKTHEKAYIVAKFNTRSFVGRHGATLTIHFDPPFAAEVQVRVHGNIRGDVVFQPGAIQFGSVDQGIVKEQRVSVSYAGRSNWKILDITNDNDHFEVELSETGRGGGRITYSLLVRLKDNLPPGYVKDRLTIVTNDRRAENQRIPLFVEGRVVPEISVTPETLVLGEMKPGDVITKKIVVRGKKPFKILDIGCGDDCFQFKSDNTSRLIHLVEITYRANENPGKMNRLVHIQTDRGDNRFATCAVSATIAAPKQQVDIDGSTDEAIENTRSATTASR